MQLTQYVEKNSYNLMWKTETETEQMKMDSEAVWEVSDWLERKYPLFLLLNYSDMSCH